LRRLIHDRSSEQVLREHALAQGMLSLRDDGMRWPPRARSAWKKWCA
jgi:general secretion pathway protein E